MKNNETAVLAEGFARAFPELVAQLGPEHLRYMLDGVSALEVAPGRTLIRDRMPVDFLYFILDGELGVYVEQEAQSRRVATVRAGEWLGEVSVLSGEHLASATIISDTPCLLAKMHHVAFEQLIAENDAVARVLLDSFIALMAKRLRASTASS